MYQLCQKFSSGELKGTETSPVWIIESFPSLVIWMQPALHIWHASKVMLKVLQARLQGFMYRNLPMFKLDLERAEEPEIKLPISTGSSKKQEFQKNIYLALLTMPKPLTVWITTNCGKLLKRWEYQNTLPASWEICMQVKKQQLEWDMEQQTGSKLGKEYIKAVYCHLAYSTSMQSTAWEMPGWMKLKLGSRLLGETSITSDMQVTPPLWQKVKKN